MNSIYFVTNISYQARGRSYGEEDLFLIEILKNNFSLQIVHPSDLPSLCSNVKSNDLVLIRNSGPVIDYYAEYLFFRTFSHKNRLKVYNSTDGKADMVGKDYLVNLYCWQYPVIATIDNAKNILDLPDSELYVFKAKNSADSNNIKIVPQKNLFSHLNDHDSNTLIQPYIRFEYEVSFYYIDQVFQYSLYAPDVKNRWKLELFAPSETDLNFAQKFIDWNNMKCGIQRVDACRTLNGELQLMELEDLNPYLSLLELDVGTREAFVNKLISSLKKCFV